MKQSASYGYDAFGRRSWKHDSFGITHFVWDDNRLLNEWRGARTLTWVYEDDGFAPLTQISATEGEAPEQADIYWYHNDQAGMPRELSDACREICWQVDYRVWDNTLKVHSPALEEGKEVVHQPLRFQGQYQDAEMGLHYNRFRYYDPDIGRFISQDPIGLRGGLNLYGYAPNPLRWIDPLGLSCESSYSGKLSGKVSEITPLVRGSKAWNKAIKDMQAALSRGEKFQVKVQSSTDAKAFLQEAQGNMNRYKAHTQSVRPDGVPKYSK